MNGLAISCRNINIYTLLGFPGGAVVENPPVNAGGTGDANLIPGSGRSPGEGNGNLENPMDRGVWWAAVHAVSKSWTQLIAWACTHAHLYVQQTKYLNATSGFNSSEAIHALEDHC